MILKKKNQQTTKNMTKSQVGGIGLIVGHNSRFPPSKIAIFLG